MQANPGAHIMSVCDVCGNDYDRAFSIRTSEGREFTFDSFECAIHQCAPRCANCACRVIGHGIEARGMVYCCAHCARVSGVEGVADNTDRPART
jgi:hypothetical protein